MIKLSPCFMKSGNRDVREPPDSPYVSRKIKGKNIASLRFLVHVFALIIVRFLGFLRRKTLQKEVALLQAKGQFLSTGNCHVAQVALTFDDGPHPSYTPQILEILQRYGIKATFFCVGQQVATYPDIVKQAYLEEHLIGNHSWSHPILALLSRSALRSQLTRTSDTIEEVLGVRPVFFRPPSSVLSPQVLRQTHLLGMKTVLWDVEAKDWANPGIATIANHILDQTKPGSIILLHDSGSDRSQTVAALPAIIEGLQQRGFQFVTLDQIVKDLDSSSERRAFHDTQGGVYCKPGKDLQSTITSPPVEVPRTCWINPHYIPNKSALPVPQTGSYARRKQRPKKRYMLTGILLFLFLAGSVSSLVGYIAYNTYTARYHTDLSLAQTGMQHLQKAEALLTTWAQKPLDVQLTGRAKHEFASALKTFSLLNEDLKSLPAYLRQVPVYGERLSAALHVLPLAITLSQAGVAGSDILNTLVTGLHDPLTPQGRGITESDLVVVTQDVKELGLAFELATREINQLQPADMQFDPRVSKLVGSFRKDIPAIQGWLDAIEQFLPVVPTLLGVGRPANYLIEVLDSTELRPAGGFIGNYGIATFSGGHLAAARITDVDLLDGPFAAAGHVIPYPAAYSWFNLAPGSWSFRDSNLDADFPTAARYGEQTYIKEGGNMPVQGVIAITPVLIEYALAITGPIAVPEYQETVTAQNLIARIHFHQLGGKAAGEGSDRIASPDGHSSLRKRFTELLAEHFLARVRQLSSADLSKLLLLMANAVRSKDIQLYFNSSIAENLLHRVHFDAAIQTANGDSLFVVDANIARNKANNFITYTLKDRVTLDAQGNALHHTSISYAWLTNGQNYGSPHYRDYARVYVPPGSVLQMQSGWQSRGTSQTFGDEVWSGVFTLSFGQTNIIMLTWTVPHLVKKDVDGWHYQYLIQKQAGIQWKLDLQVTLPECTVMNNISGGLVSSSRRTARLTQALNEDTSVGIKYNC